MNKIIKNKTVAWIFIVCLVVLLLYHNIFSLGKKTEQRTQIKTEIKKSEKAEKTYKKEFDSLSLEYAKLEKVIQEVKPIYLKSKETIKYITSQRIEQYIDTLCRDDVIVLKKQLGISDSLINIQEKQIDNKNLQLIKAGNIIIQKDKQITLYKKQKPKIKPLGIGIIGGYGLDFQNGAKPFIGIGISYNLIRL